MKISYCDIAAVCNITAVRNITDHTFQYGARFASLYNTYMLFFTD